MKKYRRVSLVTLKSKNVNFLNEKNIKITKQEHALDGSTYNVEILNSFNP